VAHYLGASRLLAGGNANGFIPGEAAAAVLCSAAPGGLRLAGLGLAREEAHIYNGQAEDGLDLPLRGDGMARAHALALDEAQVRHPAIGLKIGDLIGEAFWFRQAALAMQRVQRERSEVQPIWAIGASLGNVGAAVVPLMLGWAMMAKSRGYAPPGAILMDASNDDGACGAVVGVAA
jgi:3-oxoacyl-[acyl-carrier-protein] synthase-1